MKKLRTFSFLVMLLMMFESVYASAIELSEFDDVTKYNCTEKEEVNVFGKPVSGEAIVTLGYFTTAKTKTTVSDRVENGQIIRTTRTCTTTNPSWNWKNIALTAGGAALLVGTGLAYTNINFADTAKLMQTGSLTPDQTATVKQSPAIIPQKQTIIDKNIASQKEIVSEVSPEQGDLVEKSWFDQPMTTVENDDLEASPYGPTVMQGLSNEADTSAKLAATAYGTVLGYSAGMSAPEYVAAAKIAGSRLVKPILYSASAGAGVGAARAFKTDEPVLKGAVLGAVTGGTLGALVAAPYQGGAAVAQVLGASGRGQALAGMGTLVATPLVLGNSIAERSMTIEYNPSMLSESIVLPSGHEPIVFYPSDDDVTRTEKFKQLDTYRVKTQAQ